MSSTSHVNPVADACDTTPDGPVAPTEHLLRFLHQRDVPCPACGYNLRNLSSPTCPECEQPLHLTVGMAQQRVGLLVATVAPCIFSGIAAGLLAVPLLIMILVGRASTTPTSLVLTDIFGWLSGLFGLAIMYKRGSFLRQRPEQQRWWVRVVWITHIGVFSLLLYYILYFA